MTPQIILASASPRRAEILRQLCIDFRVEPAEIDETERTDESPEQLASRLALAKACAVACRVGPSLPVLAADTVVTLDGRVFGKPLDRRDGVAMLNALSGRTHRVITAVAVARGESSDCRVEESRVTFREIEGTEAAAYWATGEPWDKAGGYGIQGVGGTFVTRIEGSYSGIVGLPVALTESMLLAFGVNTWRNRGG